MHISSLENLRTCLKKHVAPDQRFQNRRLSVLDIGSADINGSYRPIFDLMNVDYMGVDLVAGPGVDHVLDNPYSLPFGDAKFDITFSGQTFEHADFFWKIFEEMTRVTRPDGLIVVITPSAGPVHRYPVDCYRFNLDSMDALARLADVHLVDAWRSDFGPWCDVVGVFRNNLPSNSNLLGPPDLSLQLAQPAQNSFPDGVPDEVEHGSGTQDCYEFLSRVQQIIEPRFYAEIGVEYGKSLQLADCPALGIDPAPQLIAPLDPRHKLCQATSDDFFWLTDRHALMQPIDLCYIDGMHQIEFVLRDFMYMERHCHSGSVVIIDDIYPTHPIQGERIRRSRFWTGDVWKIVTIFRNVRPDLILMPLDTSPTGSLLVLGLDPTNNALWEKYDLLIEWSLRDSSDAPEDVIHRTEKFDPRDPVVEKVLNMIRHSRDDASESSALARISELLKGSLPRVLAPT